MAVIFFIFFVVIFICSVFVRTVVLNPISSISYSFRDTFNYFRYRLFNKADTGHLQCYVGSFGSGKTLSMAHYLYHFWKRYNNKKYYDFSSKREVVQRVIILSNFSVSFCEYIPLSSLSDVVEFSKIQKQFDEENSTRTVLLVAIDEASCQLNSRNFKSNIDPLFLNTLITCRHYNINFVYSSQKFKLTDALLRSVTQEVITCRKMWRVMKLCYYDADVVEIASDVSLIQPRFKKGWFIKNSDFSLYDTLACVSNLSKDDSMLSYDEILGNLGINSIDNDAIKTPSKKLLRLRKGKK